MSQEEFNVVIWNLLLGAAVAAALGLALIELFYLIRFYERKLRRYRRKYEHYRTNPR